MRLQSKKVTLLMSYSSHIILLSLFRDDFDQLNVVAMSISLISLKSHWTLLTSYKQNIHACYVQEREVHDPLLDKVVSSSAFDLIEL